MWQMTVLCRLVLCTVSLPLNYFSCVSVCHGRVSLVLLDLSCSAVAVRDFQSFWTASSLVLVSWRPQMHTVSPVNWCMLVWLVATSTQCCLFDNPLMCVAQLEPVCLTLLLLPLWTLPLVTPLRDPADRNWLDLPGSVLVPVTGGG